MAEAALEHSGGTSPLSRAKTGRLLALLLPLALVAGAFDAADEAKLYMIGSVAEVAA